MYTSICIFIFIFIYRHTYIHTYIVTYIYTYTKPYIYTYTEISISTSLPRTRVDIWWCAYIRKHNCFNIVEHHSLLRKFGEIAEVSWGTDAVCKHADFKGAFDVLSALGLQSAQVLTQI